jgi:hypothetical protein
MIRIIASAGRRHAPQSSGPLFRPAQARDAPAALCGEAADAAPPGLGPYRSRRGDVIGTEPCNDGRAVGADTEDVTVSGGT